MTKNRQNTVFFAEDFERGLPHPWCMVGMPGASEWIILLILAIFLFGAKRIPELARNLGRAKGEFQAGIKDVTSPSRAEIDMDRGGVSDDVANENE